MPRNVRNFWVDLSVDGRSDIGTGPRSGYGGIYAQFYIRNKGDVAASITIDATARANGSLRLRVLDPEGKCIFEQETER